MSAILRGHVCRTIIPRTVRLSEAPSFGQPITALMDVVGRLAYRGVGKGGQ